MMWFAVVCVLVAVTEVLGTEDMATVVDLKRKFKNLRRERIKWQIERPESEIAANSIEPELGAISLGYASICYYISDENGGDFGGDSTKRTIKWTAKSLLSAYKEKAVVVHLDWRRGSRHPLYWQAAANVQLVARITVKFVKRLMEAFPVIKASNIHFVGFSLGAQLGGYFARQYFEETGDRIGQITALDAARPIFEDKGIMPRKGDATFIEAIHTSAKGSFFAGKFGIKEPYADVDFYPNGGYRQPGCSFWDFVCSHLRSVTIYARALEERNDCPKTGKECKNYDEAINSRCTKSPQKVQFHLLGESDSTKSSGIISFKTPEGEKFCKENPPNPPS